MRAFDIWVFRDQTQLQLGYDPKSGSDLRGYAVETLDGLLGKVDEARDEAAVSYLIVATGPWILGQRIMPPAGLIQRVDEAEKRVAVSRKKDQIKSAPKYDALQSDAGYRSALASYYGPGGRGYTRDAESASLRWRILGRDDPRLFADRASLR